MAKKRRTIWASFSLYITLNVRRRLILFMWPLLAYAILPDEASRILRPI